MDSIEILALVVTAICLVSFSTVFTILFRHYYRANVELINTGEEDIALIDNAIEEERLEKTRGRKIKRLVFKIIGYTFFGIILVIFGVSLYTRFSGNMMPFGDSTMVVIASGSMQERNNSYLDTYSLYDQISTYDIVGITKYPSQNISEGGPKQWDVVAFYNKEGTTIVHRIREVTTYNGETVYVTRGDSNTSDDSTGQHSDGYLHYSNIIGKYNGTKIPYMGIFVIFLQSNAGIITIVAVAYCLLMFDRYNAKYEYAIEDRTEKLIKLLGYDLSEEYDEEKLKAIYKQEVLYKDTIYTFTHGKYIGKETIEDEAILNKIKENMIFIQSKDEESETKDVKVVDMLKDEETDHKNLSDEEVNKVIENIEEYEEVVTSETNKKKVRKKKKRKDVEEIDTSPKEEVYDPEAIEKEILDAEKKIDSSNEIATPKDQEPKEEQKEVDESKEETKDQ